MGQDPVFYHRPGVNTQSAARSVPSCASYPHPSRPDPISFTSILKNRHKRRFVCCVCSYRRHYTWGNIDEKSSGPGSSLLPCNRQVRKNQRESNPVRMCRHLRIHLPLRNPRRILRVLDLLDEGIAKFGRSSMLDYFIFYKAYVMSKMKKWNQLRPILEDFLKKNPDNRINAEGLTLLGEASLKLNQTADAERFFRQALSSWR